jgi:hypothetical protein
MDIECETKVINIEDRDFQGSLMKSLIAMSEAVVLER